MKVSHRSFLWRNKSHVFWASVLLFATDALVFVFPVIVKWILDRLSGAALPSWLPKTFVDLDPLWFSLSLCSILVSLAALSVVARYYWRVHIVWSFFPLIHQLRIEIFQHLSVLVLDYFRKNKSGDILSTISEDTEKLRMTLSFGTLCVVDTLINYLIFPWMLWWLSPELSLYVIPFLLLSAFSMFFISDRLTYIYDRVQDLIAEVSAKAFETIGGIRVIKAFAREKHFENDFEQASRHLANTSASLAPFESIFLPGLRFSIGLSMAFVLIYGGIKIFDGEFSISSLVAFQLYLTKLDWPVIALGWFIEMYRRSSASKKRLNRVLRERPQTYEKSELQIPASALAYDVKELSFSYPSQMTLFRNLKFQLKMGAWYGMSGPLGSGKSTLLQILSRSIEAPESEIYFFGERLESLSPALIEKNVLYLPQDVFLFSKSLRANLLFGIEENRASDEELERLLRELRFDMKALELRGGLWTRMGERGVNVSGGQKQRIAIGRALLRPRKVYFFDDIFSHLDAETEAELFGVLRRRLQQINSGSDFCVVMISQRIETLANCDQVIVLANQSIEYMGPWEGAIKNSAYLHRLEYLQRKFKASA